MFYDIYCWDTAKLDGCIDGDQRETLPANMRVSQQLEHTLIALSFQSIHLHLHLLDLQFIVTRTPQALQRCNNTWVYSDPDFKLRFSLIYFMSEKKTKW